MSKLNFHCNSCDLDRDFSSQFSILIIEKWGHGIKRFCKDCRKPKAGLPDVFFDGKPEENLADDPHTGKPRVFSSKGEKAAYLKERGIREAGDRYHGAPFASGNKPSVDSKHAVKMALKQVREMGADVRRQAYLKVVKEGGPRYAQKT